MLKHSTFFKSPIYHQSLNWPPGPLGTSDPLSMIVPYCSSYSSVLLLLLTWLRLPVQIPEIVSDNHYCYQRAHSCNLQV